MPEEPRAPLVDFSALAKILPIDRIYTDLASRGFQQVGFLFEDFVKCIRLALPAVQLSAVDQDRFRKAIEDPYFRVSPEHRTLPAAQLVGQVLEGIRYEQEGTPLWEMFEELRQRGCDKQRFGEAHPAFGKIIAQMSFDEASLLKVIGTSAQEMNIGYQYNFNEFDELPPNQVGSEFPDLVFPHNAIVYANHLEALGLINDLIGLQREQKEGTDKIRIAWKLELSAFGRMFFKAVLRDTNF